MSRNQIAEDIAAAHTSRISPENFLPPRPLDINTALEEARETAFDSPLSTKEHISVASLLNGDNFVTSTITDLCHLLIHRRNKAFAGCDAAIVADLNYLAETAGIAVPDTKSLATHPLRDFVKNIDATLDRVMGASNSIGAA